MHTTVNVRRAAALAVLAAVALGLGACSRYRHAVGPDEGQLVASRHGNVYHSLDCGLVKRIKRRNLLYYRTGDDAYKDGFTPCRTCHPERKLEGMPPS